MILLPPELAHFLPADTAQTWETIAPHVPRSAYLAGGTGITAHLRHRVSQDLDFFLEDAVDFDALAATLESIGTFAITRRAHGTLNGMFSATKVQFLDASTQVAVDAYADIGGLRIASLRDLVATKLKVIGDRGELRDYFDLMAIEQRGGGAVEQGLGDYLLRYAPTDPATSLSHIIKALGYLDDVDEDDLVPERREVVANYWQRRQPAIVRAAGRLG